MSNPDLGNPMDVYGVSIDAESVRFIECQMCKAENFCSADVRNWLRTHVIDEPVAQWHGRRGQRTTADIADRAADRIIQRLRKAGRIRRLIGSKYWAWDDAHPLSLPRIVCAAIRNERTGLILTASRHYDSVMRFLINSMRPENWLKSDRKTQGFADQFGTFWDRQQAWLIAEARGQIRKVTGTAGTLYSEDLY